MTNPYIYTDAFGGERGQGKAVESGTEKEIELSPGQTIMIADKPSKITHDCDLAAKYTGKFLYKKNNVMTVGVCVDTKNGVDYKNDDIISVSFVEHKALFSVNVKILDIRKADSSDKFDVGDMTAELNSLRKYDKYIFEILPLTAPERQQRREFYRMPLSIDIFYKITDTEEINDITCAELKFNPEKAKETKKTADAGLLEKEQGYMKLTTVDVSAGGFKYRSEKKAENGIFWKCILIINDEALPAVAQVLSSNPDEDRPDLYDVRVLYHRISDSVRDRVIKYIFAKQRQTQSKFFRKQF